MAGTTTKINGDCFRAAVTTLLENEKQKGEKLPDMQVVHAWVTQPETGKRHCHAFNEWADGRLVLDNSNGHNANAIREIYYKAGEITETELIRYSYDEILINLVKYEHYGPWAEMFED